MRKHGGAGLVLAALALAAPEIALPQADATDTFVKGTTDFLLDRANDNYIYIFQKKLEANPLLQKYLPETLRVAKAGDIRSLIMHKDLWKNALEMDLVGDGDKLFAKVLDESTKYVEKLCTVELSDAAAEERATACSLALPQINKVLEKWKGEVCKKGADGTEATQKFCADALPQISEAQARIEKLKEPASDILKQILASRKQPAEAQGTSAPSWASPGQGKANPERTLVGFSSPGAGSALTDLTRDLDQIRPDACQNLKVGNYTGCVIEILAILQAVSHADYVANCYFYGNMCSNGKRSENANREEDDDFSDFRRYALFFAQLADSVNTNDRSQVNALLKSVTIPPVSFGIKREPHATRVLITAYLGVAGSRETAGSHTQAGGFVVPVGIEISQARDSGNSLSLLLSPLDFGYPLTLKMKNVDTTIKGSDVVVPAAYVFWGFKNYPLAIGAGYSRGRGVDNPDQRVGRYMILFAFDMPLFRLH